MNHRWGEQQVSGSMERMLVVKRCKSCAVERRTQYFGQDKRTYYWVPSESRATDIRPNCSRGPSRVSGEL